MLNIAILGNEENSLKLKEQIIQYNIQSNMDNEVTYYTTPKKLLNEISSECIYNIIFVDLDYEKSNSLKLVYYMRQRLLDEETAIIFLSSAYLCESALIKLHPFDYITTPFEYKTISECLNNYMRIKRLNNQMFRYIKHKSICEIEVSSIIYFQSNGKKITLHTANQRFEFYGQLSRCQKQNCIRNFIEIHQSFLVNPIHIKFKERNYIIVTGDIKLPVSRTKLKNLK